MFKAAGFVAKEPAKADFEEREVARQEEREHWRVSVAPMMDWTDRHFRFFMRRITQHALLYTEMITTQAILYGDREKLLGHDAGERPLALQLGGNDPYQLAVCSKIAEEWGYQEVNLNVGCPSDRVQQAVFGAVLMREPERVAECVGSMRAACSLPVTVKHRIGVDELDRYEDLARFVGTVAEAGCRRFIVHARKAWLRGLNPKENRRVPPLRYDMVYQLKQDFPHLQIVINGGGRSIEDIAGHLRHVDGVMIGRAAYENPYLFATVDHFFFGDPHPIPTREEVVRQMLPYIRRWAEKGIRPKRIIRHMFGLFAFERGARAWRRYLSEHAHPPEADESVLLQALEVVPAEVRTARPAISEAFPELAGEREPRGK